MRLAYFSPLNPAPSGISDYSEELLPHLARYADITLVVDGYVPSNHALTSQFAVVDDAAYEPARYDLALYHLGNSPVHAYIYRRALREAGVVVLHDLVLHHLVAWLTLERGDPAGYIAAMREAYGERGAALAEREERGSGTLNRFEYPLCEPIVRAARGVIVHSQYALNYVRAAAPDIRAAHIPMGIAPARIIARETARAQLDLPPTGFIVAAFGEVQPHKRVSVALDAFGAFLAEHPSARLILVGTESPNYDVSGLIEDLGLTHVVRRTGYVSAEDYAAYIAAADVCLNLRYPSAGETSASLLRLLGAGKATLVTRTGAYAELPDNVCIKIEPDAHERALLLENLKLLAARPDLRAALGENARAYVAQHHTLAAAAAGYVTFLSQIEGELVNR